MSPRAPKACATPGCPDTAERGTSRCAEHRREPWAGSDRRETLPSNWRELRRQVLERDGHRCQIQLPGVCVGVATEVDHVGDRDDHQLDRLRGACKPCHGKRSASQGGRAAAGTPKDGSAISGRPARARRTAPPPPPAWEPRPPIRYGGKR